MRGSSFLVAIVLCCAGLLAAGAPATADNCADLSTLPQGTTLPATSAPAVRFVAFGDQGSQEGEPNQLHVAASLRRFFQDPANRVDFGVLLGDNFYRTWLLGKDGVRSTTDPRWERYVESVYGNIPAASGILQFYPVLGNHDQNCASAQVLRTRDKPDGLWQMPAPFYRFVRGPIAFLAINTGENPGHLDGPQRTWLQESADITRWPDAGDAAWRIIYGHHPLFSGGSQHGEGTGQTKQFRESTEKISPPRSNLSYLQTADVYLAGHEHSMELALWGEADGHPLVVATIGSGGRSLSRRMSPYPAHRFCARTHGFMIGEANQEKLSLTFYSAHVDGSYQLLFKCDLARAGASQKPDASGCARVIPPELCK